jgi:autotransporter-associated beta strand protein
MKSYFTARLHNNFWLAHSPSTKRGRANFCRTLLLFLFAGPLLFANPVAWAGSATWKLNPVSGDWYTAANWTPTTIPDGPSDIASFGVSNMTDIIQSSSTFLGAIQFDPGASSYHLDVSVGNTFSLNDAGLTNLSGVTQFVDSSSANVDFYNGSTAGANVIYTNTSTDDAFGSIITFHDESTAGDATFISTGIPAFASAGVIFENNASAGGSHITVNGVPGYGSLGFVYFYDDSTAAESTIAIRNTAAGFFYSSAGAGNSTLTCTSYSSLYFFGTSTAGAATISCSGHSNVFFEESASGEASNITSSANSNVYFQDFATGGEATLTADNGTLHFQEQSDGATARVILSNGGSLTVGDKPLTFDLGSLEGEGAATIDRVLMIGGNNLDATFSGNLASTVTGDWLTKVGTGTWTLAGTGSYSGSTTVTDGALVVTSASTPTGSGPVQVNGGTLGGSGTIAGPVTIGTGTGSGAILAPAHGTKTPVTLTIQSRLTFKSDSIYIYTFRAKRDRSKSDKVVANGLTIENGATLDLSGTVQGTLTPGTVFTVIKNTSSTPISGRFGNLPQGAIVTVKGNNFQANYGGGSGDGNSLTLTVVP